VTGVTANCESSHISSESITCGAFFAHICALRKMLEQISALSFDMCPEAGVF